MTSIPYEKPSLCRIMLLNTIADESILRLNKLSVGSSLSFSPREHPNKLTHNTQERSNLFIRASGIFRYKYNNYYIKVLYVSQKKFGKNGAAPSLYMFLAATPGGLFAVREDILTALVRPNPTFTVREQFCVRLGDAKPQ